MTFETAIFVDLENLLKGYNFTQDFLANLSLKEITSQITSLAEVERLAVQRAYANWSDPRLSLLRSDILDLGIDPIQVFGFSKGPQKNAADVQLAIDAMEILHTRSFIKTFVIVSGDGAFASLARKLHEYGKIVVGCAYRNAANKVFEAVCDRFVWLEEPVTHEEKQGGSAAIQISDPRILRMSRRVRPLENHTPEEIYKKTREVFQWFLTDAECAASLREQGLYLSPIREALSYAIPNFVPQKLGFSKFLKYLQFFSKETDLAVFLAPPSEVKMAFSSVVIKGFQRLPPLDESHIHTEENYRELLLCDSPIFRLPSREVLKQAAGAIQRMPPSRLLLKDWIEGIQMRTTLEPGVIKAALFCFLSAGCFVREPEAAPVAEQTLHLQPLLSENPSLLLDTLRKAVRNKLEGYLSSIKGEIFEHLIASVLPLSSSSPSPPASNPSLTRLCS